MTRPRDFPIEPSGKFRNSNAARAMSESEHLSHGAAYLSNQSRCWIWHRASEARDQINPARFPGFALSAQSPKE